MADWCRGRGLATFLSFDKLYYDNLISIILFPLTRESDFFCILFKCSKYIRWVGVTFSSSGPDANGRHCRIESIDVDKIYYCAKDEQRLLVTGQIKE